MAKTYEIRRTASTLPLFLFYPPGSGLGSEPVTHTEGGVTTYSGNFFPMEELDISNVRLGRITLSKQAAREFLSAVNAQQKQAQGGVKHLLSFLDNAKQTGKMSTEGGVYLLIDTFGLSKQFARSIMNQWVQSFKAQGGVS